MTMERLNTEHQLKEIKHLFQSLRDLLKDVEELADDCATTELSQTTAALYDFSGNLEGDLHNIQTALGNDMYREYMAKRNSNKGEA